MKPPKPPKITAVEVIAAQPTEADSAAIAHLSAELNRSLPQVVNVVKVRLKTKPPTTSMGWALYVNDVLIPKYWEYNEGIYFTVQGASPQCRKNRLRSARSASVFPCNRRRTAGRAPAAAPKSKKKAAKGKGGPIAAASRRTQVRVPDAGPRSVFAR